MLSIINSDYLNYLEFLDFFGTTLLRFAQYDSVIVESLFSILIANIFISIFYFDTNFLY